MEGWYSSRSMKSWMRLMATLALMTLMICLGSTETGKRRRPKRDRAVKATSGVRAMPMLV